MRRRGLILLLVLIAIAPSYCNGWYNVVLAKWPVWFWVADVAAFAGVGLGVYVAGRRMGLFTAAEVGLGVRTGGDGSGRMLFAMLFVVPLVMLLWVVGEMLRISLEWFPWPQWHVPFTYNQMVPPPGETGWWRLLAVAYMAVSAGLVEEFVYRGMFRLVFGKGWRWGAVFVVVSSVVFAGAHWEGGIQNMTYALGWGVCMAVIYEMTGNLWPVVVAHMLVDWGWFSR